MQISHRTIQIALKKALAPQEVWLEKSFPQINRIADVVWPNQNIIFEVQCSPISAKEVQARTQAYQKIGYTVVWILHDRCFNRSYLTPAEHLLRSHPHYFTNINAARDGEIYDQYAQIRRGRRVRRTARYPIALNQLDYMKQIPRHIPKERRKWILSFGGDLFHQKVQPVKTMPFRRFYHFLFQLLLDKICH